MYFLTVRSCASTKSGLKEINPAFFQAEIMLDLVFAFLRAVIIQSKYSRLVTLTPF
jgi:hypothetical protein